VSGGRLQRASPSLAAKGLELLKGNLAHHSAAAFIEIRLGLHGEPRPQPRVVKRLARLPGAGRVVKRILESAGARGGIGEGVVQASGDTSDVSQWQHVNEMVFASSSTALSSTPQSRCSRKKASRASDTGSARVGHQRGFRLA
jgi:hypothetical protein